jgi:hypothetical protein
MIREGTPRMLTERFTPLSPAIIEWSVTVEPARHDANAEPLRALRVD